eukprot:353301-Chlamydomonas_euryale.AAC.3
MYSVTTLTSPAAQPPPLVTHLPTVHTTLPPLVTHLPTAHSTLAPLVTHLPTVHSTLAPLVTHMPPRGSCHATGSRASSIVEGPSQQFATKYAVGHREDSTAIMSQCHVGFFEEPSLFRSRNVGRPGSRIWQGISEWGAC